MLYFLFIGWILQFVVQSLSCVCLCNFMNPAHQTSLSFTISWRLLELMSIVLVMPSHHCIFCCPLLLLSSSFPASVSFPMSRLFASGGQSIGASASASVLPMNLQGWFAVGFVAIASSPLNWQNMEICVCTIKSYTCLLMFLLPNHL